MCLVTRLFIAIGLQRWVWWHRTKCCTRFTNHKSHVKIYRDLLFWCTMIYWVSLFTDLHPIYWLPVDFFFYFWIYWKSFGFTTSTVYRKIYVYIYMYMIAWFKQIKRNQLIYFMQCDLSDLPRFIAEVLVFQ